MEHTTTDIVLFVLLLLLTAASLAWPHRGSLRQRLQPLEAVLAETGPEPHPHIGRKVVVNTRIPDDQSLQGILLRADREWTVLQAPKLRVAEGETARWDPLPAEVALPTSSVSWMHLVPAEPA